MLTNFRHRLTNVRVRVEEMMMLAGVPLGERRQLLRDGLEKAHDDPDRSRLHVIAELLHGSRVLQM